jgi:hypothetical protein
VFGLLLMPVATSTQSAAPPQRPASAAAQARVQIPANGRIVVARPRPGQVTQLVISVANGGLVDGQSEPTEVGKGMISRFIASLREVDNTLESYVFLIHSYSTPKTGGSNAGDRGQRGAAATAATAATTMTARGTASAAAARNSGAAAARATVPQTAVAQPQSGRGAAAAEAVSPAMVAKMQTVQTVRGTLQTGRAAAIQRLLVDSERVATDRIRVYAHGEARPEAAEPDAPVGDYVKIEVHRLFAMMAGADPADAQAMILMSGDVPLPPFPWPPPSPTSQIVLDPDHLPLPGGPPTLGQVGNLLVSALDTAGYPHHSYLAVPHGFALVAQLEQIKPDGTPATPNRWDDGLPSMAEMSFGEFLKALLRAPIGNYRVIAFIVTDIPWQQNGVQPTGEQAQQWLSTGLDKLPAAVRDMSYAAGYQSTALVYQFAKSETNASFVKSSPVGPLLHLDKAGLLQTLRR